MRILGAVVVNQLDWNSLNAVTPRLKNEQQLNVQRVVSLIRVQGRPLQHISSESFEAALGVEDPQRQNPIHDVRESLTHKDPMTRVRGILFRSGQIASPDHGVAAVFAEVSERAVESSCGIGEIRIYQKNQFSGARPVRSPPGSAGEAARV